MQKQKKKKPKGILNFLVVTLIVLTMLPMTSITSLAAPTQIYDVMNNPTDTYYELTDSDKTLTISGTGATPAFGPPFFESPWYVYSITTIIVENGVTVIGENAFIDAQDVSSVTIADSVTEIHAYAFQKNNRSLTSISLPAGITSISNNAFDNCSVLNDITFNSSTPPLFGGNVFRYCSSIGTVHVPVGKLDDYRQALQGQGLNFSPGKWSIIDDVGSNAPSTPGAAVDHGNHSHQHYYQWTILSDASLNEDGVEQYRCSCGDVKETLTIPASQAYIKELYGEIKNAPQDAVIEYDTGRWTGISDYVIKKLADRPDVSTRITFEYEKVRYTFILPAGVSYEALLQDQETYYGFFSFCKLLGIPVSQL